VEEKKNQKTDKDLHPERYDESLFKRAYKAGLELKKLNDKEKKNKFILQISLGLATLLIIFVLVIYFLNQRPPQYTSPVVWNKKDIVQIYNPNSIYGFDNFNTDILAESALAFNPDSGEILFAKDIDTRRQIASLTKIMTSIVVMENMELDDVITVDEIPMYGEEEIWAIELEKGDIVTVENLLKMMLISSYNDAAIVLAESIGSEEFISLMNQKAESLGLRNTHFSNPCGFDNSENHSTVNDLKKLVTVFLQYPTLADIVSSLSTEVEYIREGEVVKETIFTTNSLLDGINVKGIKTGYTEDAGRCLITMFEYEDGEKFVTILLNSDDRYEDTGDIENEFTILKGSHQ
jgi:D-alanyl-D-alanine carboxypeptidase (penicillin-binding protein 5/6)